MGTFCYSCIQAYLCTTKILSNKHFQKKKKKDSVHVGRNAERAIRAQTFLSNVLSSSSRVTEHWELSLVGINVVLKMKLRRPFETFGSVYPMTQRLTTE